RVDRDHGHAPGLVIVVEGDHAVFAAEHVGAVVAGEDDDAQLGVLEQSGRVSLAVDAGEGKVGRGSAELKREWHGVSFVRWQMVNGKWQMEMRCLPHFPFTIYHLPSPLFHQSDVSLSGRAMDLTVRGVATSDGTARVIVIF